MLVVRISNKCGYAGSWLTSDKAQEAGHWKLSQPKEIILKQDDSIGNGLINGMRANYAITLGRGTA